MMCKTIENENKRYGRKHVFLKQFIYTNNNYSFKGPFVQDVRSKEGGGSDLKRATLSVEMETPY